jgi:FixJ family two-component response regulator
MGSRPVCDWSGARVSAGEIQLASYPPPAAAPTADIAIIDSDDALCQRLGTLFHSVGLHPMLLAGPDGLLERGIAASVRCLLMEVRMRGANGLDFHARLLSHHIHAPVVFMTAHGDIQMAVRAMKAGAVDFLTKPLREQDVLDAVAMALERERQARQQAHCTAELRARMQTLTHREYQIFLLATTGQMNKQIAAEIGLSEVTVKMHRGTLMRKMGARTVAELTRMATVLELAVPARTGTWHGPAMGSHQSADPKRGGEGWHTSALVAHQPDRA